MACDKPFQKNIFKENYRKALKKLTLFLLLNPLYFDEESYQKNYHFHKNFFISYVLSDQT